MAALGNVGVFAVPRQLLATTNAAAAIKTYTLPAPTMFPNAVLIAKKSTWKWMPLSKSKPGDVEQQRISNCYLAATLAALANSSKGRSLLEKLVREVRGKIVTICHDYDFDYNKSSKKRIASDRYYEVRFGKSHKSFVSDVLYMDEGRYDNPRYMTSRSRALWPCIIEAAYASYKGSYEKISGKISMREFFKDLINSRFVLLDCKGGFKFIGASQSSSKRFSGAELVATFNKAGRVPVVAASKDHAVAVLGIVGQMVRFYDPAIAKSKSLHIREIRKKYPFVYVLTT